MRQEGDEGDEGDEGEKGDGGDRERDFPAPTAPPSGRRLRARPHALFPRAAGSGPEDRDIQFVGLQRKYSPAAAKKAGFKVEYCPREFPADELTDWAAVYELFGGGAYKVCAKDSSRHILCWAPHGEGNWYVMSGRSKPLADEVEEEEEAPPPPPQHQAPAAAPAPPAAPALDIGALLLGMFKMQEAAAARHQEMMIAFMRPRAAAETPAAAVDPFAGLKLGVDIMATKAAQQPVAAPAASAASVDPLEQTRAHIKLAQELQGLAPAGAGGGTGDVAEIGALMTGFSGMMQNLKSNEAVQPQAAQATVLIDGRWLTEKQAVAEYSRRMAGPPLTPAPAPPLAPAPLAPALAPAPLAPALAPAPLAPAPAPAPLALAPLAPAPLAPAPLAPASDDVDLVIARLADPAFAARLDARLAAVRAAQPPVALSAAPSSSGGSTSAAAPAAEAAPAAPAPASPRSSSSAGPTAAATPTAVKPGGALASVPPELIGHVADLDPAQFTALAKMHPDAIAQSVRGLPGMDDAKASKFGEAIGALPPAAMSFLAEHLPAEARKFLGMNGAAK